MKRILTALTVATSLIASGASAFDPDDLQKLKDTGDCVACDLEGAFLANVNLEGARLNFARLRGTNLSSVNMEGAELMGANLMDAFLDGTNLMGARLNYAKMKGAILCNTIMPDGSVIYSGC
jgi:uncharacterized protein YjbI with pentapeptide repeats